MTPNIFSPTVDNYIRSERQRSLQIGCQKCIVNDKQFVMLMRSLCHRSYIRHGEKRICGAFNINRFYLATCILFKKRLNL